MQSLIDGCGALQVLSTFRILAELPPDSLGAYIISMAHTASDVLAVVLMQVRWNRPPQQPLHLSTLWLFS